MSYTDKPHPQYTWKVGSGCGVTSKSLCVLIDVAYSCISEHFHTHKAHKVNIYMYILLQYMSIIILYMCMSVSVKCTSCVYSQLGIAIRSKDPTLCTCVGTSYSGTWKYVHVYMSCMCKCTSVQTVCSYTHVHVQLYNIKICTMYISLCRYLFSQHYPTVLGFIA